MTKATLLTMTLTPQRDISPAYTEQRLLHGHTRNYDIACAPRYQRDDCTTNTYIIAR